MQLFWQKLIEPLIDSQQYHHHNHLLSVLKW